jgi:hypothetical protein
LSKRKKNRGATSRKRKEKEEEKEKRKPPGSEPPFIPAYDCDSCNHLPIIELLPDPAAPDGTYSTGGPYQDTLPPSPDGGGGSFAGPVGATAVAMKDLGAGAGGGAGAAPGGSAEVLERGGSSGAAAAAAAVSVGGAAAAALPLPAASLRGPLAALSYGLISLGIVFFNKMTLDAFPRRNFLSMVQMIVTIGALRLLESRGAIELAPFERVTARRFLPVSLMSLANILSGLLATQLLTVPMFSVLRRVSTLFTISAEFVFLGTDPKRADIYAVLFWVAGAAVSGWADLYFTVEGYLAAAANSTATALYYVLLKRVNEDTKLSSFSLLYYNSVLSLPFQAAIFLVSGEHEGLLGTWFLWFLLFCFILIGGKFC